MRKLVSVMVLLLSLMLVISACGSMSAAPTQIPVTATKTGPTKSVEPTKVAEPTKSVEPTKATSDLKGEITVAGSTTVQPIAEKLASLFMTANPQVRIAVQGGGSSTGVKSAGEGTAQIGTSSREVKSDEKTKYPDLKVYEIARDAIAIVANPGVKVENLTKDQVREIFSGKITNWKEVGGEDKEIVVVSREEGSGTRDAFQEMVMGKDVLITDTAILQPSNGAVRTTVSTTPDSIAFLSLGYLDSSIKAVKIGGVEPSEKTALDGTYPIVRPLSFLTKGEATGAVKAFIDYALSTEGQSVVEKEGYIPLNK